MSVRITSDENVVAIFDSVTGWAFGPTFDDAESAQAFLDWLPAHPHPLNQSTDARMLTPEQLTDLHTAWLRNIRPDLFE